MPPTDTDDRTAQHDAAIASRTLGQLARHLPTADLGTLANLTVATPDALERLQGALMEAFNLLDAEGNAAVASLVASAVERVRTEAESRPQRPSLGAASARVNRSGQRAAARLSATATGVRVLTASGAPVDDTATLTEAFERAVKAAHMDQHGGTHLVASARWVYPEDRRLDAMDSAGNADKIEAVVSPQALVASGGVCNPVDVDFSIPVFSSDARPLKDGLPTFGATRGGLRFQQPPTLTSVGAAGTTVWTEAIDANPGTTTKPVYTVTCGAEIEVFVDAIPTRIKVGNMTGRFYPELVSGIVSLTGAAAARVADNQILNRINALSTTVSSAQLLGAARDLLATIDQVSAAMRYRQRLQRSQVLTVVLPEWARDLVRADLARTMAHGDDTSLHLSDADVDALLSVRGLHAIWHLDGQAATTTSGIAIPLQGFGAQSPGAGAVDWPHTLTWNLFPEGAMQILDGGTLDVSVVRDSTLNATNDFEIFHEVFEGVAYRGVEALQIATSIRPNGLSAGSKDTSAY